MVRLTLQIVYHGNGGSGAPSTTITRIYAASSDLPKTLSAVVSSSTPSRSGFSFLGWAQTSSATSATIQGGQTLSYTFTPSAWTGSDLTFTYNLYAVWTASTYIVGYGPGDYATGPTYQDTKTGGVDLRLRGRTYTRSGYNQTGWSVNSNGSVYSYALGGTYSTNDYIVLYPYWSIIKSTITSVTDSVAADGSTQGTVEINRPNSSFTHKVVISIGTRSAEYTNVGTSLTFTIPAAWVDQIPSATSGVATVTLTTYNNGSQVGTPDAKSFTITVPESVVPTISLSGTNVSSNATVTGWDILVQGFSKISLSASASAGSGASIVSIVFFGDGVSQTGTGTTVESDLLTNAGQRTWTATVTDSRGRTATATLSRMVHEYFSTAILTFSSFRSTDEGNPSPSAGTMITAAGNYVFASCGGNNSASVKKIEYKKHTDQSWTTGTLDAASGGIYTFGPISLLYIYDVKLTVTDALGSTASYTVNVSSVSGVSFGLNGRCARFGGPVQYDDRFECDWDAQFDGQIEAPLFLQTGFVAADTVEAGTTKIVSVTFDTPFQTQPYVAFSMTSPQTIGMELCSASSWNINQNGFSARLTNGSSSDRTLGICWIATARKDTAVAILTQPISQTANVDDEVIFSVEARNATNYQWKMKGPFWNSWSTISGDAAKSNVYKIKATAARDGFMFKCTVSNNFGTIDSVPATLTVSGVTRIIDRVPYIKRVSGGGLQIGDRENDKIVGGTVCWNQFVRELSETYWQTDGSATVSYADGVASILASARYGGIEPKYDYRPPNAVTGEKVIAIADVKISGSDNAGALILNGTHKAILGSSDWQTVGMIVDWDSSNNNRFRIRDQRTSDWDTYYVKNIIGVNLTQLFGSSIADYLYSLEQANSGDGIAWFTSLFGYSPYNAGMLLSVKTSAHVMRGANDSVVGNYTLDSTIELRGIPKLDENNKLYYDGDEYESDGTVTRKYATRAYQSGDSTDGSTMVTDGTTTVYALTENSEETAAAYSNPQVVDPDGTEEYTDSRTVQMPVGHETWYKSPN